MKVYVDRLSHTALSTHGEWRTLSGRMLAFSMELPPEDNGVRNVRRTTCILPGEYECELFDSPHFGRVVLRLKNVEGRDNIEAHPMNEPSDGEGCIGTGTDWNPAKPDWVGRARLAFDVVMGVAQSALLSKDDGKFSIIVREFFDGSTPTYTVDSGESTPENS